LIEKQSPEAFGVIEDLVRDLAERMIQKLATDEK
jgi:hypothetical protein